ncbi:MAG: ARPP-1 family domain-containing protein [Gemmataceae bacterium]
MATVVRGSAIGLLVTALALVIAVAPFQTAAAYKSSDKPAVEYRFSGPYTHGNLTIFFVHGKDRIKDRGILTLEEALRRKQVIVRETKNVNRLVIWNGSANEVLLQAGDILRGGQQDRTIAFDTIVPPRSGWRALAVFCVEAHRWAKRGQEAEGYFMPSINSLAHNTLKIAARKKGGNQSAVWENVAKTQKTLKEKLQTEVRAEQSQSSLELTLANNKVVEAVNACLEDLQDVPEKQKDAIGCAAVINGKVNNADVYASSNLFHKLWAKLLKASAVEALAEKNDKKFEAVKADAVRVFFADAEKGEKSETKIDRRFRQTERENAKSILFETSDGARKGVILRRSYVAK